MILSSAFPTLILHRMWSIQTTKMLKSVTLFWTLSAESHSAWVSLLHTQSVKQDPLFPLSGYTGAGGLRVVMHFPERQMSEGSALQEMNRFLWKFSGALLRRRVQLGHEDGLRFLLFSDRYKHVVFASENLLRHILNAKGVVAGVGCAHEAFKICAPLQSPSFVAQVLQVENLWTWSHAIEKSQKFTATAREDGDLQRHIPPVTVCLPQAED